MAKINNSLKGCSYELVGWTYKDNKPSPVYLYKTGDYNKIRDMYDNLKTNKSFIQYDLIKVEKTFLDRKN